MGFSAIQIILVFVWVFIIAIDQFNLLESLYQPIVSGAVIGAILGDLPTGLVVGGTYQLMTIGNMPVGGAQPPNAVIGALWLLFSQSLPVWTPPLLSVWLFPSHWLASTWSPCCSPSCLP